VDAIKKQLPSRNKDSIALDRWTLGYKLAITLVVTKFMDRNLVLGEVQLPLDAGDRPLFSYFNNSFRIIGQGSTCWSMASQTFEGSS
jgi:hypothetical protein